MNMPCKRKIFNNLSSFEFKLYVNVNRKNEITTILFQNILISSFIIYAKKLF